MNRGAGDGNRTRMTSLEGFGSGGVGQLECRSGGVAMYPRVTVNDSVVLSDRARSGHGVCYRVRRLALAPWPSSLPSELRITRVFLCVARALKACPSFMFACCCWWQSLAIDGNSGTSRGHGPVIRSPGSRWDGAIERPSANGRTCPKLAQIVRVLCVVAGHCW
jgi:hypothetical protein